jgi:hypothetical protein
MRIAILDDYHGIAMKSAVWKTAKWMSKSLYETFYRDSVTNITNWILNQPGRDR